MVTRLVIRISRRPAARRCRIGRVEPGSRNVGLDGGAADDMELQRVPKFLQQGLGNRAVVAIALELPDERVLFGDPLPGLHDVPIRLREGFS